MLAIIIVMTAGRVGVVLIVVMPIAMIVVIMIIASAQTLFLGGMFGFFAEQRFAVFLGNLVIVGMDFAERQKSVATAAIIDERRLQRRLDPSYLGKIDVALKL